MEIKALACELPVKLGLPFSRLSHADIACEAMLRGIVISISVKTVWRYLHNDAIKPWMHRSWLFPRDPLFGERGLVCSICISDCSMEYLWDLTIT